VDSNQLIVGIILTAINLVCTIVIAIFAGIIKRGVNRYDALEDSVIKLNTKVAILIDRDRRKRVADYESEEWPKG
jgi:hypothetical protein